MPSVPKNKTGAYKGIERRRMTQRKGAERRDDVRWEPKSKNRRRGRGRRKSDLSWGEK